MIMEDFKYQGLLSGCAKRLIILSTVLLSSFANSDSKNSLAGQSHHQLVQRYQVQSSVLDQSRAEFWQPVESSQAKLWVIYTENLLIKRVIDFQREQIRISYQGESLEKSTPSSIQRDTEKFLLVSFEKAYRADDLLPVVLEGNPMLRQPLINLTKSQLHRLYSTASFKREKGLLGDILTITIDLPQGNIKRRAASLQPIVERLAKESDVSPALAMAIIHHESAFNLLASTPEAKLGLMLIAPKQVDEIDAKVFYQPELNIEYGIKQLAKLEDQLSGIEDPQARQLCVIAAYRVGVHEVARVFTGRSSLSQALPLINQLSARQVRGQLRSQLQVNNSALYVNQVSSFLALYDEW